MADGEAGAKALNALRAQADVELTDPAIAAAWDTVLACSGPAWLALGYESKKKLKLLGCGTDGGYSALRALLADDQVVYGAFRCADPAKLVFVAWVGEDAGGMVKGRATAHTQSVESALEGTQIGIQLAAKDEAEPAAVAEKLKQALKTAVTL